MKGTSKLRLIVSMFLALLIIITANRCQKDEEKDEPPELPPVASLLMDFSDFNNPGDTITKRKSVESYRNWGYAVGTVAFWNILATWTIGLPVMAYAEAFNQDPVYLGENSWQWSYDVTLSQVNYSAKLISKRISNEEFTMKMLVTKSGPEGYEDFKWFEGTVRYDRTSASWILYENPDDPNELISIDWEKDWEADTSVITYTYIRPGAVEYGNFIEYRTTNDSPYDSYYTVSVSSNTVEIEWNSTTREGRIKNPMKFGDSEWHCWDENLMDIDCQ